jgi:hypothetical protein
MLYLWFGILADDFRENLSSDGQDFDGMSFRFC